MEGIAGTPPPPHYAVIFNHKKSRRTIMPHVIVKLFPGRSEEQKVKLADEIAKDVVSIAKCDEKSVSVAFEEIEKEEWAEKVYRPDILNKKDSLYKEPGYDPFE
jgi:4-oxalocrotonate tautomerase